MLLLYSKYVFFAAKLKCTILFAHAILLALLPHTPQKKNSLLMIFLKISSLEPHLKLATKLGVYEPCQNLFLKLAKDADFNSRRNSKGGKKKFF
jgi:hypothetical protein